jgi:hypothetical protein
MGLGYYRGPVAEFGVLQHWMDKEIPLRVVLQAIEQVVRRLERQKKDRTFLNVCYIKPAVETEYVRWRRALA